MTLNTSAYPPADAIMEYLLNAFETRTAPLACDVVLVENVAESIRRNTSVKPSNVRVGQLLAAYPFYGQPRQIRANGQVHRVIILRRFDEWAVSSGRDILALIANSLDPLCD